MVPPTVNEILRCCRQFLMLRKYQSKLQSCEVVVQN